jgi:hypothetical protein
MAGNSSGVRLTLLSDADRLRLVMAPAAISHFHAPLKKSVDFWRITNKILSAAAGEHGARSSTGLVNLNEATAHG